MDCGSLLYATWTAEFRRRALHVENLITVPLHPPSAQRSASNTEAYRQKSTPYPTPQPKNSKQPRHNVSHPTPKHTDKSQHRITHHNPRTSKKSPRGVQRGRGFTAPLRFSTASQSKKTRPSAKQESKNKTKNQPHNKQRKRKSQRKIKKKNKRKNKGEKA